MTKINELPVQDRVRIGVRIEDEVAACLNRFHHFNLTRTSGDDDMFRKIDFIDLEKDEKYQFKSRHKTGKTDVKDDILAAVEDPYGSVGRDMKNKDVRWYICLNKTGEIIRVVDAQRVREIIDDALDSLVNSGMRKRWDENVKESRRCDCFIPFDNLCELRVTMDAGIGGNQQFKILAFVYPERLPSDVIRTMAMVWPEGVKGRYYPVDL
tara:strand:+ start:279 stop:908 length:630 start_codon:yes stop_codon:yes gene_type:complete